MSNRTSERSALSGRHRRQPGRGRPGDGGVAPQDGRSGTRRGLEAANNRVDDIIKVTAYPVDLCPLYNEIYWWWFAPSYSAGTTISTDLSGLQIELEAIARRPMRRREPTATKEVR